MLLLSSVVAHDYNNNRTYNNKRIALIGMEKDRVMLGEPSREKEVL